MSCCSNCNQGLTCGGQTNWLGLSGLRGLGDEMLSKGSRIRVGFHVSANVSSNGIPISDLATEELRIMACLFNTGYLDSVGATFTEGWLNDYLTVEARTLADFGQAEDVGGFIQQKIQECAPLITVKSRDAVVVDSVPGDLAEQPGVQQPNYRTTANEYKGKNAPGNPQKDCWNNTTSWTDYLACEMGVTPTSAATLGVVGALLAVVLISKIAR